MITVILRSNGVFVGLLLLSLIVGVVITHGLPKDCY